MSKGVGAMARSTPAAGEPNAEERQAPPLGDGVRLPSAAWVSPLPPSYNRAVFGASASAWRSLRDGRPRTRLNFVRRAADQRQRGNIRAIAAEAVEECHPWPDQIEVRRSSAGAALRNLASLPPWCRVECRRVRDRPSADTWSCEAPAAAAAAHLMRAFPCTASNRCCHSRTDADR